MIKDGFINVLKPTGMTSNDLVAKLRGIIKKHYGVRIKVGHTGTLDPNAAGVMLIAVGGATKFTQYVIEKRKTYIAEILLGKRTDTLDTYGVIEEESVPKVHPRKEILQVLDKFSGKSMQIPPKFSALKIDGQRLYKMARGGKEVPQIRPREIEIDAISLIDHKDERFCIQVTCSAGTYIRSLANDIGEELSELAILSMLIRTDVDAHSIQQSYTLEEIEQRISDNTIYTTIIGIDDVLSKYPSIHLKDGAKLYMNGAKIRTSRYIGTRPKIGLYRIYYMDNFIGIGRVTREEDTFLKSETMTR